MEWMDVLKSVVLLFAIVNPIGSIPLFLQLTNGMDKKDRARTFKTGVTAATVILSIFIIAGERLLTQFFQIQISDLMAAGGLLLLIIAIDHLVFGLLTKGVLGEQKQDAHRIGAVPIACPILAGPGAMMTVLLIASRQVYFVAIFSVLIVFGIAWLIFKFIDSLYKILGEIVCIVLSKILCLFIAAIGIRLLMQGLVYYLK